MRAEKAAEYWKQENTRLLERLWLVEAHNTELEIRVETLDNIIDAMRAVATPNERRSLARRALFVGQDYNLESDETLSDSDVEVIDLTGDE